MFVIPYARIPAPRAFVPAATRTLERALDPARAGSEDRAATLLPPMDVAESDSHYRIVLDVPGATRDRLEVTIEGRRVSIATGEQAAPVAAPPAATTGADAPAEAGAVDRAAPAPAPALRSLYRERTGAARYARTVVLPADVDQAGSEARLEHGVLTLTLAKRVPTGAKRISVD